MAELTYKDRLKHPSCEKELVIPYTRNCKYLLLEYSSVPGHKGGAFMYSFRGVQNPVVFNFN